MDRLSAIGVEEARRRRAERRDQLLERRADRRDTPESERRRDERDDLAVLRRLVAVREEERVGVEPPAVPLVP
jgi:hypothetical protein